MKDSEMKLTEIMLTRCNKILVLHPYKDVNEEVSKEYIGMLCRQLLEYGYGISENTMSYLSHDNLTHFIELYKFLVDKIPEMCGADRHYRVFYPNFPEQVKNTPDDEIFINAILHYMSGGIYELPTETREYVKDKLRKKVHNAKILQVATKSDVIDFFNSLITSKVPIAKSDQELVEELLPIMEREMGWSLNHCYDRIVVRENAAIVAGIIVKTHESHSLLHDKELYTTMTNLLSKPTDVLRLITFLSDGDVSLATNTRFKSFSRATRRYLLSLINSFDRNDIWVQDQFAREKKRWVRIAEKLHPNEGTNPKFYSRAANLLSSLNDFKTVESSIEEAINTHDISAMNELIYKAPGLIIRNLDRIIRQSDTAYSKKVIDMLADSMYKVSTSVLCQVHDHFNNRSDYDMVRVFNLLNGKNYYKENDLKPLSRDIVDYLQTKIGRELLKRYKNWDYGREIKSIYISNVFNNLALPRNMRDSADGFKVIPRNSRFVLQKSTTHFRPFVWWTNPDDDERLDIDLSASLYDKDFKYLDHCSYTNIKCSSYGLFHSGDITNGGDFDGQGVTESIDINIPDLETSNCNYVVFSIHAFTSQLFSNLEHLRFGFMELDNASYNNGVVIQPDKVDMLFNSSADANTIVTVVYNVKDRTITWVDKRCKDSMAYRNVENKASFISAILEASTHKTMTWASIIMYHALSNNIKIVTNKDEADYIFDFDGDLTPYDYQKFAAEWM